MTDGFLVACNLGFVELRDDLADAESSICLVAGGTSF